MSTRLHSNNHQIYIIILVFVSNFDSIWSLYFDLCLFMSYTFRNFFFFFHFFHGHFHSWVMNLYLMDKIKFFWKYKDQNYILKNHMTMCIYCFFVTKFYGPESVVTKLWERSRRIVDKQQSGIWASIWNC